MAERSFAIRSGSKRAECYNVYSNIYHGALEICLLGLYMYRTFHPCMPYRNQCIHYLLVHILVANT